MLLPRLVGGTTAKFQSFLSYSLESEWCVDGLTLAQVTRDPGAGGFQPFATWGDGRAAAHQPCRLQGQEHAGLGVGAWAAIGHRWTDTSQKCMALILLLYHLDSEWCTPMYCGTPDLCLASPTHNHISSQLWLMPHVIFFIPTPQLLPVYVSVTSAFEGRGGTVLSRPEISAAVVAEGNPARLFCPHTGAYTNCTYRRAREDEAQTHKRYPRNLQRKQVLDSYLFQAKIKCWLFWVL